MESATEQSEPKRVVIADDDESTRILLLETLGEHEGIEIVGAAKDGEEAIELVDELEPDVAILDWSMPGGGGSRAAEEIKSRKPNVAIVALTGMDPMEASYDMLSKGAVGFLQKGCSTEQLVDAIRSAARWRD